MPWLKGSSGRTGGCGTECGKCPYFRNPCPGCITRICLVAECIRGKSYDGITHPKSVCILRSFCRIGGKPRPSPLPIITMSILAGI